MACESKKQVGKVAVFRYYIGCGNTAPLEAQWNVGGAMRTKSFEGSWDTADATADDSYGAVRENLATFLNFTFSGDGVVKTDDSDMIDLSKHFFSPDATSGQPVVWMQLIFPDLTYTAHMLMTTFSREAPYDDVITYSLEASATASPFGVMVTDTTTVDMTAVTSVAVSPDTASVSIGGTVQLTKAVLPVGAPQGVTWVSSNPAVATVSQFGVVTGVTAGSATITVRSNADQAITDTAAITVSA